MRTRGRCPRTALHRRIAPHAVRVGHRGPAAGPRSREAGDHRTRRRVPACAGVDAWREVGAGHPLSLARGRGPELGSQVRGLCPSSPTPDRPRRERGLGAPGPRTPNGVNVPHPKMNSSARQQRAENPCHEWTTRCGWAADDYRENLGLPRAPIASPALASPAHGGGPFCWPVGWGHRGAVVLAPRSVDAGVRVADPGCGRPQHGFRGANGQRRWWRRCDRVE